VFGLLSFSLSLSLLLFHLVLWNREGWHACSDLLQSRQGFNLGISLAKNTRDRLSAHVNVATLLAPATLRSQMQAAQVCLIVDRASSLRIGGQRFETHCERDSRWVDVVQACSGLEEQRLVTVALALCVERAGEVTVVVTTAQRRCVFVQERLEVVLVNVNVVALRAVFAALRG